MSRDAIDPAWLETQLRNAQWRTSSFSSGGTNCIQVAFLDRGLVAIRDSKQPQNPPLLFSDAEYDAFVKGIEHGELRRA
ncbi:hypothetical protein GCM10010106_17190 [Thermopolyspora flexuosa]|uniref:Uncharacterized protein DUF397 n=1 Tax=Thermopolyspora flexuosa TaxID=103836 RepID=A0A543J4F1_9ACTN|nr:DUF397 domain-containing protein [Thermopolyspora flexuosa]TQM77692.1 uncharacterized protein DUF397 [Thermopolyspora flexuosa]GGM71474.1 hypothetical protein GCM10010106_17190 [Thermopolyspora flexuosa]